MGRLLTLQEVADRLRVPLGTVYGWRAARNGPPGIRIGKHVRVDSDDLAAWLEARRDEGPAEAKPSLTIAGRQSRGGRRGAG